MTREEIEQNYPEDKLLFADGFDEAIIGVAQQFNSLSVAYDKDKCISILMTQDEEMTIDDAEEYFSFNIIGSYVGEHTPSFIYKSNGIEEGIIRGIETSKRIKELNRKNKQIL